MIQRSTWLASALGGTVLATGWAAWQAPDAAVPVVPAVVRSPGTGSGTQPDRDAPPNGSGARPTEFHAQSTPDLPDAEEDGRRRSWAPLAPQAQAAWAVPAPAVPPPAPRSEGPASEARPEPPAFPYQWIGGMDDGEGGKTVFLGGPRRTIAVRAGDRVDEVWRLEPASAESPPTFTWLPGGQSIVLEPRR